MNRGFGFYFGNAIKSAAKTLWRKGNLIKYFAWVIMELLSPLTLILVPMFSLANVRQAKIAERENVIDIPQSFKVACKGKPFGTMLLAIILEALIFLAGIALIGVAGGLLGALGYIVALFVDTVAPQIIILIFLAPALLLCLVYCIIMPLMFAPTSYVIETNPDIGAADAISVCFNTMKSRGKGTFFLNFFIPALVEGAILGFGAGLIIVIGFVVSDLRLAIALLILICLITFIAFALVAPMFALARKISNKNLFEDIVLDPVNASKRTSGVNIRRCKGAKFDPAEYENELALLFDETASDRVPIPETPSAKRKRELEERRAVRSASAVYTEPIPEEPPATHSTPATTGSVSDPVEPIAEPAPATEEVTPVEPEQVITEEAAEEPAAETPAEEPAQAEPETAEPTEPEPAAEEVTPVEPEQVNTEEAAEPAEEHTEVPAEEPAAETIPEQPAEENAEEPAKKTTKKTSSTKTSTKKTTSKSRAKKTSEEN